MSKATYRGLFNKHANPYSASAWRGTSKERGLLDPHRLAHMDSFVKDMITTSSMTDIMYESEFMCFTYNGVQYKTDYGTDLHYHSKMHLWEKYEYTPIKKEDIVIVSKSGNLIYFTYKEDKYSIIDRIGTTENSIHQKPSSWQRIS